MAWKPLGWTCVAVAEIEPFPCAVLAHHYPGIPNLGDVTKITQQQIESLGHIDVVVLGFPCQDLSIAGQRKGLTNADGTLTRSGLFYVAMRIVEWSKARWTIGENVPGLFSSHEGCDFASVVGELAGAPIDIPGDGWRNSGVALGPRGLVEWFVLDAQYVRVASHPRAVPQRRRRVFFVRDTGDWASRPPLFLNAKSMQGNPPPRRIQGQRPAPTLAARTRGGGGLGGNPTTDNYVSMGDARTLLGKANSSHAEDADTYVAHSLTGEGFDASEDGSGRATPVVAVNARQDPIHSTGAALPLDTDESTQAIAIQAGAVRENPESGPDGIGIRDDGASYTIEARAEVQAVMTLAIRGRNGEPDIETREDGTANAILTPNGGRGGIGVGAIATHTAVRRLTPRECERLQGFPDDYTAITFRGKPAADGNRYRALGNSVPVRKRNRHTQNASSFHAP